MRSRCAFDRNASTEHEATHRISYRTGSYCRLQRQADPQNSASHFNDLGVRKYDLPALLRRVRNHFRGPAASNPKLVSYLAAGGIQGLRPLRYEKRVARNRFIFFFIVLFLMLLGLVAVFFRH